MPSWLQGLAEHQPVSVTCNAVRALFTGYTAPGSTTSTLVFKSLAWAVGILLVFAPYAVRVYRRKV